MVSTGVLGDTEADMVVDILNALCPNAGARRMGGEPPHRLRTLVVSGYNACASRFMPFLNEDDLLIINADVKNAKQLIKGNKAPIITFGRNARACVTASSVVESHYLTVQCCVQRKLPTLLGGAVCEQEFSVNVCGNEDNVDAILAAVTTALVWGAAPGTISETVIRRAPAEYITL